MYNNIECAKYLRKHDAYSRLMKEFRKKWESYGRVAGVVTLKNPTVDECRSIGGIVGKSFSGDEIKISFKEFEAGLQKTRFAPIEIKTVMESYFGTPISTKKVQRDKIRQAKENLFEQLIAYVQEREYSSVSAQWLCEMRTTKKYGYLILLNEFAKSPEDALTMGRNVCDALAMIENLGEEGIYLAVFSAKISGNPHYFDMGTAVSQLLTHAICLWKELEFPKNAYDWRECMEQVGVISDTISSMVHTLGVKLCIPEGFHPAYEAFCERREPCIITAENLKYATGVCLTAPVVYVVENEMVFLFLAEALKNRDVVLICTSGQIRIAAFRLLDYIAKSGAEIFYSGDLDPEGMDIAERLWKRYGAQLHLWRMNGDDYKKSISDEILNEHRLAKLKRLSNPVLCKTAECILNKRCAGYQEHLLADLLSDLQCAANG